MNYTERAKQLGFSAAAVMDTKNLVFKPEYRVFLRGESMRKL